LKIYHLATLPTRPTPRFMLCSPLFMNRTLGKCSKPSSEGQGCQIVCFQTKNPNLGKFWKALDCKFMPIWIIFWRFGIFYDYLVHFVFIFYIFSGFGIMYQEKSGNPGLRTFFDNVCGIFFIQSVGAFRVIVGRRQRLKRKKEKNFFSKRNCFCETWKKTVRQICRKQTKTAFTSCRNKLMSPF
jgi:hypothetical protein